MYLTVTFLVILILANKSCLATIISQDLVSEVPKSCSSKQNKETCGSMETHSWTLWWSLSNRPHLHALFTRGWVRSRSTVDEMSSSAYLSAL